MKVAREFIGILGIIAGPSSAGPAVAQTRDDDRMPEGPNRELVIAPASGAMR